MLSALKRGGRKSKSQSVNGTEDLIQYRFRGRTGVTLDYAVPNTVQAFGCQAVGQLSRVRAVSVLALATLCFWLVDFRLV